jgi:hypothetical protein
VSALSVESRTRSLASLTFDLSFLQLTNTRTNVPTSFCQIVVHAFPVMDPMKQRFQSALPGYGNASLNKLSKAGSDSLRSRS